MAKKKLAAIVKIQIPAGQATPAPPVGTALGPHGINIMDFCKAYNAATENQRGMVIPAEISIFEDRSFTFVTKTPPTPFLLRQAAGIEKGAANPRTDKAGMVIPLARPGHQLRPARRQAQLEHAQHKVGAGVKMVLQLSLDLGNRAGRVVALCVAQRKACESLRQFQGGPIAAQCIEARRRPDDRGVVFFNAACQPRCVCLPPAGTKVTFWEIKAVGVPEGNAQQPVDHLRGGRPIPFVVGSKETARQAEQRPPMGPADLSQDVRRLLAVDEHFLAPGRCKGFVAKPGKTIIPNQGHHPGENLLFALVRPGGGRTGTDHAPEQRQRVYVAPAAIAIIP
jgi:large subunit ribosomal protein L11